MWFSFSKLLWLWMILNISVYWVASFKMADVHVPLTLTLLVLGHDILRLDKHYSRWYPVSLLHQDISSHFIDFSVFNEKVFQVPAICHWDFNYLHHLIVNRWQKIPIHFYVSAKPQRFSDITSASNHLISPAIQQFLQQHLHGYNKAYIVALCDPWILLTKGQWCKKTFYIMPRIQGSVSILSKSDWSTQRQTDRAIPQSNSPGFNLWSPIGQAVHHQMTSVSLGNGVSQLGKLWLQTVAY